VKELAKKHCESKELTDKKGKAVYVADVGDGMELRIEKCKLIDGTVGLYSFLFYRLWLSMIFVTQEDEKKTSATAPESESTNESATPITMHTPSSLKNLITAATTKMSNSLVSFYLSPALTADRGGYNMYTYVLAIL
jgi:hypothetical protein